MALRATAVYPDQTAPQLSSCSLDLDNSELTLTFDEPVRAASFAPARVELRDTINSDNATESVVLSSESTASEDAYSLIVSLSGRDTSTIKANAPLGQSKNSTYCVVRSRAVTDCGAGVDSTVNSNKNFNDAAVKRVQTLTPDVTSPSLSSFTFDLDTNDLVLTFDVCVYRVCTHLSCIPLVRFLVRIGTGEYINGATRRAVCGVVFSAVNIGSIGAAKVFKCSCG